MDRDKFGRPLGAGGRNRSTSDRDVSSTPIRREENPSRSGTWDGGSNINVQQNRTEQQNSAPPSGGANASKFGNTYGLSASFLESLWINGPLVSKVFVANVSV